MSVDSNRTDRPVRTQRRHLLLQAAACLLLAQAPFAPAADPALPAELKPPAKPTPMPAFELPTTSGSMLRSESLKGQVLVIRFWASW